MDRPDPVGTEGLLAGRTAPGASASEVAAATVAIWADIEFSLIPVVGTRGVDALYRRSLQVTGDAHPWMAASLSDGVRRDADIATFAAILASQSGAIATDAANAFLQTFHDLLVSLIGASLTERLLRPAQTHASSGSPTQDPSP